ncbi:hypothetical protein D910_08395 [Dendroctonus ponderosae]
MGCFGDRDAGHANEDIRSQKRISDQINRQLAKEKQFIRANRPGSTDLDYIGFTHAFGWCESRQPRLGRRVEVLCKTPPD